MEQIENIKRRIQSSKELRTVVKNMKSLAAVNIRFYQNAAEAAREYKRTIRLGLSGFFSARGQVPEYGGMHGESFDIGVIVFGSEQGMCGGFNEKIMDSLTDFLDRHSTGVGEIRLVSVGTRIQPIAAEAGRPVDKNLSMPNSLDRISDLVDAIILVLEHWRLELGMEKIYMIYNRHGGESLYRPAAEQIFPITETMLEQWRREPWPGPTKPPLTTMDGETLFRRLADHYLYSELFKGVLESMESENAARLAAMEAAEKNIEEKLAELGRLYNVRRQQSITSELLDIIGGFEAISSGE
ncbi:MAG: F0F1 ATP synthase subunit gamma [Spirochaetia bacterium]